MLDRAPCGFVSFDAYGTIRVANTTLGRMLDVDADALVGRSIEDILTIPARIFYQTHFVPLIKLHGHADEIYFTLRAKSGTPVHVLANAALHTRDGESVIDCVMLRIHERQKYEQELLLAKRNAESANAAKMRFLSMVSHDLRTPLGAISGYADVLLLGARGEVSEPQARDLRRIKEVTHYLLVLLDDLLTFARAEAGGISLSLAELPVENALARADAFMAPQLESAGIRYERLSGCADVRVEADADRLQQILLNLLGNAAKFTPRGGTVTVQCTRDGDHVRIGVRDTDRGIPAHMLKEIFEPFVQIDTHPEPGKQRGMGLGLAISRELARAMHGDLTVASELGKGSTFTLRLPAA